jgi:hypothetical protein
MSLVDVSELMTDPDFVTTITLRRPVPATFAVDGSSETTYAADVPVTAIVQPADAQQIVTLPEGSRGPGAVKCIWSATALRMADGAANEADVLIIDGISFKVVGEERWDDNGYRFVLAAEFSP